MFQQQSRGSPAARGEDYGEAACPVADCEDSMREQAPGCGFEEEPVQEQIFCQVSSPREDQQCSSLFPEDCTEAGKIHERLYPVDGTPHWSRGTA